MSYVGGELLKQAFARPRSATSGRATLSGLGAASSSAKPPTPSYYASPSALKWTDNGAKAMHDTLVAIDASWTAVLKVWESIPGIDLALQAVNVKKSDVEKIASLPFPVVSQLALVLEGTFGQRALDDEFRGILDNAGATVAAFSGYFGVCATLAGVFAGIGAASGFVSFGISEAAAAELVLIAAINAALAGILGAVAALCFGVANGKVDCGSLNTSVQTTSTGLNTATASKTYTVSSSNVQSACQLANAADAKLDQNSPYNKALRAAKKAAKAKTAVANALARLVGVSYTTLFTAAGKSAAVNAWITASFVAAAAGQSTPAPPAAVIAAIPGAKAPTKIGHVGDGAVDFGGQGVGASVPLEPPSFAPLGIPWWGWALGLVGGGFVIRRVRRR